MMRNALRYPSGPGIPEAPVELLLGRTTLLMADHYHRAAGETADPPHYRRVVGKAPVAVQLLEVGEDAFDVIEGVGSFRVSSQCETCHAESFEKI